jgi:hypothetical protein
MGSSTGPCGEDDSQQKHPQQLSSLYAVNALSFHFKKNWVYSNTLNFIFDLDHSFVFVFLKFF